MDQEHHSNKDKNSEGIRVFTLSKERKHVHHEKVLEGIQFSTGTCVVQWLATSSKGSISIWNSINEFIDTHVKTDHHQTSIIIFDDGSRFVFKPENDATNIEEEIETTVFHIPAISNITILQTLLDIDRAANGLDEAAIESIFKDVLLICKNKIEKSQDTHDHVHGHQKDQH